MAVVLLVEDDPSIRFSLNRSLARLGHVVRAVGTAAAALRSMAGPGPEIVVLDLGLPDLDGREVLRMIRGVSAVPVIVATARDDETEIVGSLDSGADDYLVKPFSAEQLSARIGAVLRRSGGPAAAGPVTVGELRIDLRTREVRVAGAPVELTAKEFDLLAYLAERAGTVVSKPELLSAVWHRPYGGADKTVDVHLSWLRRKLGESARAPRYLQTMRGTGIKLVAPDLPGEPCA